MNKMVTTKPGTPTAFPCARLIEYNEEQANQISIQRADELAAHLTGNEQNIWLHVYDIDNKALIEEISQLFDLHQLVLEGLHSKSQRPRLVNYGDYLFFVARLYHYKTGSGQLQREMVYFVFGPNYVLTFQRGKHDIFHAVYNIKNGTLGAPNARF